MKAKESPMVSDAGRNDARLTLRLPRELKETIEDAAMYLDQSVRDFAVSTLARTAQRVLQEQEVTRLSRRDWDTFIAALEETDAKPNKALRAAAKRYRDRA